MATCLSQTAISKNCGYVLGGLSRLWYANYSQYSACTQDGTGTVTAITLSGAAKFYEIEFEDNQASYTDALELANGNRYIKQGVTLKLARKDASMIDLSDDINLARMVFVCQDRLGNRYLLGRVNGLTTTISDLSSGTAVGDFAGWSFAAEGFESARMAILSTSVVLAV